MSALAKRQVELVRKFDDELLYWLDGVIGVMHVGGVGGKLDSFRRGRESNRPPVVTLEPKRNGQLMLGMVVSRPKQGRLTYDTVLGHWDLSIPIRHGGPLNEAKPRHRRVASWGLQLLRAVFERGCRLRAGTPLAATAPQMPRVLIPFPVGEEKIDPAARRMFPDAVIDTQTLAGKSLVDSRIVPTAETERAINEDTALEDFRPVMGQRVPNPFRHVTVVRSVCGERMIPLSEIHAGAAPEILAAARSVIGRGVESGASDEDVVAATKDVQQDLQLSLFSHIQVLPVESAADLPAPYAGSLLPPVSWRTNKNQPLGAAVSA